MKNEVLSRRVKELRVKNGLSQESLAEECSISLRTIQRIENGITIPHGHTLLGLAKALHVGPDELVDWSKEEDRGQLNLLNLSALLLLVNPFLGTIIPLVLWITKRDRIEDLDETGIKLLNFQMTMLLCISIVVILFIASIALFRPEEIIWGSAQRWADNGGRTSAFTAVSALTLFAFLGLYYIYSTLVIVANSIRIHKGLPVSYTPAIHFIR